MIHASSDVFEIPENKKFGLRCLRKEKPALTSNRKKSQEQSGISYIIYLTCISGGLANTICLAQNNKPLKLKLE